MAKIQNCTELEICFDVDMMGHEGRSYVGDISLIQRETAPILKDKKLLTEWNLGLNKRDIFAVEERDQKHLVF